MIKHANCPGCRIGLRIPLEWLHQPIRCKSCGMVLQLQEKAGANGHPFVPVLGGNLRGFSDRARPKAGFIVAWLMGLSALLGGIVIACKFSENGDSSGQVAVNNESRDEGNGPPKEWLTPQSSLPSQKTPGDSMLKMTDPPPKTKNNPLLDPPPELKIPPKKPPVVKNPGNPPPQKPPADSVVVKNPDNPPPKKPPADSTVVKDPPPVKEPPKEAPIPSGPSPRRALSISVNNPFYFNPVSYGPDKRDIHALMDTSSGLFARRLKVPASQLVELSDGAPGGLANPPRKDVIMETLRKFLESSRAQDRVIVLFAGHALEIGDEVFLVPLEGESGDKESLLPLTWAYEQLSKCKARQKILIVDVCRYNPTRGNERPGSGPMGEKLDAALAKPPAGVQVWSSCVAGQYSYEKASGSLFLNALVDGFLGEGNRNFPILGSQRQTDPVPIVALSADVNKWTEADANRFFKEKQTPRLAGEEITSGAAPYNAGEPLPPPVKIEWASALGVFGTAKPEFIREILKETDEIPAVKKIHKGVLPIRPETMPIFLDTFLKDYRPDQEKTPFREAVSKATAVLKQFKPDDPNVPFKEEFHGKPEEIKKGILDLQKKLANAVLALDEALEEMQNAAKERDKETNKRWLANYDYVMARLLQRKAYIFEYQFLLSAFRNGELPELGPNETGWRLASREKMKCQGTEGKEAKKHAEDAKKILEQLAKDHRGTPWEILGKREALTTLGLEWRVLQR